jgi:PKHD-type hydroxylase
MLVQISDVLTTDQVAGLRQQLNADKAGFASGKDTAGWYAKSVKSNEQSVGAAAQAAIESVQDALLKNTVFMSAARPKEFVKVLVSRYRPGMAYGTHVDDALMSGKRTDLSFTLFLSDPESYGGGELVIEATDGDTIVKPAAGSMVLYQTTSLHRVSEVTRGERLAVVGWVRSFIRSAEQRETLFELDQIVSAHKNTAIDRTVTDKVFKVRNMLIRMWAED